VTNYSELNMNTIALEEKSRKIRIDILNAVHKAGKGHIGGAFSIVDVLVSLFYRGVLKFDSENPSWEFRDRFILSKGHSGIGLYAVLADLGYFSRNELDHLNRGELLGEHPDPRIPGIETVTGSLGHGLSIASGMALADKHDRNERKTFVLLGDAECYEGSVWEAAMFASHHELRNLCAIVDRNGLGILGTTESINKLEPFGQKWMAFGWDVLEIDAHDLLALDRAWNHVVLKKDSRPTVIIAKSVKGKGVSFMENEPSWHHGGIDDLKLSQALAELQ